MSETSGLTKGVTGCLVVVVALGGLMFIVGSFSDNAQQRKDQRAEQRRVSALTPAQIESEQKAKAEQAKREAEGQARLDWLSSAKGACRLAITRGLHDPDSAKFDPAAGWYAGVRQGNLTLVQPKVRAKNLFGAYVYTTWDCEVAPAGENVRIVRLAEIE